LSRNRKKPGKPTRKHWDMDSNESHARALDELGLAEKHANTANIEKESIYKAMSVAFFKLGMKEEGMRYATMAGVKY
jgi:hypothetical protein